MSEQADALREVGAALAGGRVREAIERAEAYADRGLSHPDLAYDRGVAYALRARSADARPGDLGRAAAAFEETLLLRDDDAEAARALELVRAEAARRRARAGGTVDVVEGPGLARTAAAVMPERAWEAVAVAAAIAIAVAWPLRRSPRAARSAYVVASVAAVLLAVSASALAVLRHTRATVEIGVVVDEVARLSGADGPGATQLPEGARVDVLGRAGAEVTVRWGQRVGKLPGSAVRVVGRAR